MDEVPIRIIISNSFPSSTSHLGKIALSSSSLHRIRITTILLAPIFKDQYLFPISLNLQAAFPQLNTLSFFIPFPSLISESTNSPVFTSNSLTVYSHSLVQYLMFYHHLTGLSRESARDFFLLTWLLLGNFISLD